MDIEEAREIVERLGVEPIAELTRAERSDLNRARYAVEKHEKAEAKRRAREEAKADDSALLASIQASRARAETGEGATDHAELEARALTIYETLLERLEGIANSPHSTNQDLIGAAGHLRLASSIGKSDPVPTVYKLPMASLLGADAPDQPPGSTDVAQDATLSGDDTTQA